MKKGEKRKEEILNVCANLLIERGYAELSYNKVASFAGIQVGNLQYHFPTRADLISAMLTRELQRYSYDLAEMVKDLDQNDPEKILLKSIDYLLQDQTKQSSCIVFWELWALAAHDMDAARLMKTYYQQYVDELSKLVRNMRPILSKSRADRAAVLIASLIEGASLFRGFQKSVGPASRNMESDIKTIVVQIIENI